MLGTAKCSANAEFRSGHCHQTVFPTLERKDTTLAADGAYANADRPAAIEHGWVPCHAIDQLDVMVV